MAKSYKQLCELVSGILDGGGVVCEGRPGGKIAYDVVSLMSDEDKADYAPTALFKTVQLAVKKHLQAQKDDDGSRTTRARHDAASGQRVWEDWLGGPAERVRAHVEDRLAGFYAEGRSILGMLEDVREKRPDALAAYPDRALHALVSALEPYSRS